MNKGSCLCGDISWQVEGEPQMLMNCFCSICRKIHGTDYVTFGAWPGAAFKWLSGNDRARAYASSPGPAMRRYCPTCGSAVAVETPDGGMAFMPLGALDGEITKPIDCHAFVDSRAPWTEPAGDAPMYADAPPGYTAPEIESKPRVPATEGAIGGSCQCGTVRFEFDKPFERMGYCHCSLCRHATTSACASEVFVESADFRWVEGEDSLTWFQVPGRHFGVAFCGECSSMMPHLLKEDDLYLVPTGVLDQDPGIRPMAHIFVGSKANWDIIDDDLPQFEEYPPEEPM